jgi:hypothetical protein
MSQFRNFSIILCLGVTYSARCLAQASSSPKQRVGVFEGEVKLSPRSDGKTMTVLEKFSYNDGDTHQLDVQPGFITDGASIPRALWSLVGSPFSGGNYVKAAVIHDEGCVSHKYTWQVTAKMFYTAMLDSGMNTHYALLLYYGVRVGGPKWKFEQIAVSPGKQPTEKVITLPQPTLTEAKIKAFDATLTEREKSRFPITVKEIDQITDNEISSTTQTSSGNNNSNQIASGNANKQFQLGAGAKIDAQPCAAVGIDNTVTCTSNDPNSTVARYRCDGWMTSAGPSQSGRTTYGSDPTLVAEWGVITHLASEGQWVDALNECSQQIIKTPQWLTPLLVCADANFHLGHLDEARKQLAEFQSKRGDAYRDQACSNIEQSVESELLNK